MSATAPPPSLSDSCRGSRRATSSSSTPATAPAARNYNPDYYRAARAPKALWEIPEAHHVGGFEARPQYEYRVVGFFDRALLGKE